MSPDPKYHNTALAVSAYQKWNFRLFYFHTTFFESFCFADTEKQLDSGCPSRKREEGGEGDREGEGCVPALCLHPAAASLHSSSERTTLSMALTASRTLLALFVTFCAPECGWTGKRCVFFSLCRLAFGWVIFSFCSCSWMDCKKLECGNSCCSLACICVTYVSQSQSWKTWLCVCVHMLENMSLNFS